MYARRFDDKTYTFCVSGSLWGSSLVMLDLESKSLWSHILGTAMKGPLKDTELKVIPSVIATWKTWKTDHPETTVSTFERTAQNFTPAVYQTPEAFTIGLLHGEDVTDYPLATLFEQPVINDLSGDDPILICYDAEGKGVQIFQRTVGADVLEFTFQDGKLIAGGSEWSLTTGKALDGPHKDKQLKPLSAIMSFARAWNQFHSDTRTFGKEKEEKKETGE